MTCRADRADSWTVAGRTFTSRLIVGTGKYKSFEENAAAVEASGAEIVTVAVRRVNIADPKQPMLTDYHRPEEDHLSAQHRRLLHRRGGDPHACGWRARRAAGTWSSWRCWARRRRSIPTCARRCGRPRCWRRKASSRWSIASTIRSPRSSSRKPARWRSCRWARRSARASASRTCVTIRLIVEGAERAGAGRCRRRHRERRGRGDGAGLRRRADEHRHRRGQGPGADGAGDEGGGREPGGSPISPGGCRSAATPIRQQSAGGAYLVARHDVRRHRRVEAVRSFELSQRLSAALGRVVEPAGVDLPRSRCRIGVPWHRPIAASRAEAARLRSSTVSNSMSLKPGGEQVVLDLRRDRDSRNGTRSIETRRRRPGTARRPRDPAVIASPRLRSMLSQMTRGSGRRREAPAAPRIAAAPCRGRTSRRTGRRPGRSCRPRTAAPARRRPGIARSGCSTPRGRSSIGWLRSVATICGIGQRAMQRFGDDAGAGGGFQDPARLKRGCPFGDQPRHRARTAAAPYSGRRWPGSSRRRRCRSRSSERLSRRLAGRFPGLRLNRRSP